MIEYLCLTAALLLAVVAAAGRNWSQQRLGAMVTVATVSTTVPGALIWTAVEHRDPVSIPAPVVDRPIEWNQRGYVGSDTCLSCHPHEHATWQASYHRSMTRIATPDTVIGDFNNVELTLNNASIRLQQRGDRYFADIEMSVPFGGTEKTVHAERPIVMTTGSHHHQTGWFTLHEASRGIAILPFVYLIDEKRWVPRKSVFLRPRDRTAAYEAGLWNQNCIKCHATGVLPRAQHYVDALSVSSDRMDTRVGEFGISCEACHGPGEEHSRINRDPARRYGHHLNETADETIINPARLPHDRSSQVCGQCHGIYDFQGHEGWRKWNDYGFTYRPGEDLNDSKLRFYIGCSADTTTQKGVFGWDESSPEFFWSDGMPRTSGREYNSVARTACFQRGELSCLSCHVLHQTSNDPRDATEWANDQLHFAFDGDRACLQCHSRFRDETTLMSHTHHTYDSSGSRCYNCHMPYTTYGLLKAMRSHEIEVPGVGSALGTGRPMACNQCHLDQTLQWTDEWMSRWYGHPSHELSEGHQTIAASVLWLLQGDAAQRALMAWSYGWDDARRTSGEQWLAPYLAQLLEDPYDAVRLIAHRSLRRLSGFEAFEYDFLLLGEEAAQANARARQIWAQQKTVVDSEKAIRILLNERGELLREEFDRLLDLRNDTPVSLLE